MADDDSKPIPIEVTSSSSKSASDLEAEIAATVAALGDGKKLTTKTIEPSEPAAAEKIAVTSKPAQPVASQPQKIQIKKRANVGSNPTITTKDPAVEANKAAAESKSDPVTAVHHKVIAPISPGSKSDSPEPAQIDVSTKNTESTPGSEQSIAVRVDSPVAPELPSKKGATIESLSSEGSSLNPDKDSSPDSDQTETAKESASSSSEAARKLEILSGELQDREDEKARKAKQSDDGQQQAKVYDTKEYHLPIKPSRHNRQSAIPVWARAMIPVVAVLGTAAYALWSGIFSIDNFSFFNKPDNSAVVSLPANTQKLNSVFDLFDSALDRATVTGTVAIGGVVHSLGGELARGDTGGVSLGFNPAAIKLTNDYLREIASNQPEAEREKLSSILATEQMTIDIVDMYGIDTLLSSSNPANKLSLANYISNIEASTKCTASLDEASVASSKALLNTATLERVGTDKRQVQYLGSSVEAETFELGGEALAAAIDKTKTAIEECVDDSATKQAMLGRLLEEGSLTYQIIGDGKLKSRLSVFRQDGSGKAVVLDLELEPTESTSDKVALVAPKSIYDESNIMSIYVSSCHNRKLSAVVSRGGSFVIEESSYPQRGFPGSSDETYICETAEGPFSESRAIDFSNAQLSDIKRAISFGNGLSEAGGAGTRVDEYIAAVESDIPDVTYPAGVTSYANRVYDYSLRPDGCGSDGVTCNSVVVDTLLELTWPLP